MNNKDAISKILGRKIEVRVLDQQVVLSNPDLNEVQSIVDLLGEAMDYRSDDQFSLKEQFNLSRKLAIKAIAATVKCDDEQAEQLYLVAGGETSELAMQAKSLCGVPVPQEGEEEADEYDITENFS